MREYSLTDNYLEKTLSPLPLSDHRRGIGGWARILGTISGHLIEQTTLGHRFPSRPRFHFRLRRRNRACGPTCRATFLQELMRVARHGYVTTPNRYFPVETHTRVPLLHILLPKRIFDRPSSG